MKENNPSLRELKNEYEIDFKVVGIQEKITN
jgi:hypothetical protein